MIFMKNNKTLRKCFSNKKYGIGVCLSVALLFFTSFILESLSAQNEYERQKTYGFHNGVAYDVTNHSIESLKNHLSVKQSGEMDIYGELLDDDSLDCGSIGTVDEGFKELEQLEFLDGSYPDNSNEIAMESVLLDLLHIPYEIGEEVTLSIQAEDGSITQKTYVLCGIIKSYTTNWLSNDHLLCGAIVSEYDGTPIENNLFFYGDYQNEDEMKELDELIHERSSSELIYNDYSYPEYEFTFDEFVENGGVLIGVGLLSFLFLLCIEVSTISQQLYKNRVILSLGISNKRLNHLAFMEVLSQWLLCALITLLGCTGIGLALKCLFTDKMIFEISYKPYLLSITITFVITVLCQIIQSSILKRMSVIANGKDLSKYGEKYQRRRDGFVFGKKSFIQIEKKRMRKSYVMNMILSLGTIIVLFFGTYNISTIWQSYTWNQSNLGYDYKWESTDSKKGITDKQLTKIKNTGGIESVKYFSTASYSGVNTNLIYMSYDNFLEDTYTNLYKQNKYIDDIDSGLPVTIVMLPENSSIWNDITEIQDKEEFLNGDSVIVYFMNLSEMSDSTVQSVDSDVEGSTAISLQESETVTLNVDNNQYPVKCGKVIDHLNSINVDTNITSGTVFVSEKLYNRIFESETTTYNQVIAYGNQEASFDTTDKIMSMINNDQKITFTNRRVERQDELNETITKIFYIGTFLMLFCIIALILIYRNLLNFYDNEKDRINLLRLQGADKRVINELFHEKYSLYTFISMIVLNIVVIGLIWFYKFQSISSYSDGGLSLSEIIKYGLIQTNLYILLIPQFIYFCFYLYFEKKSSDVSEM